MPKEGPFFCNIETRAYSRRNKFLLESFFQEFDFSKIGPDTNARANNLKAEILTRYHEIMGP